MSDLVERLRLNATNRDFDRGLRADNREAVDRIEALEAAQAWRPIETAPKDVEILAFDPAVHMDCIVVEWWKGCWVDANGHERFPTHWLPLPQPPGAEHD